MSLYVGLMSGTSMDAIDAVLCDIEPNRIDFMGAHSVAIPALLKDKLERACTPDLSVTHYHQLGREYAELCAQAIHQLLKQTRIPVSQVEAVASHGQTLWHAPPKNKGETGFSIQLNDADWLAVKTELPVIFDFRARDLALGGQGAPLVPAFHQFIFGNASTDPIAVLNLGGIANISFLGSSAKQAIGFDTGPANTLLDQWIARHKSERFDHNGVWAQQGALDTALLNALLNDPYFSHPPPKSSGREYFNLTWLEQFIGERYRPVDVQRTLVELTAKSVAQSLNELPETPTKLVVCGGGAFNRFLLERIQHCLSDPIPVVDSSKFGVDPQHVEAMAFAWLGWCFDNKKPANLPSVTGASQLAILGKRVSA